MKKHPAQRLIFLKVKPYGLALIKTDMINQEKWPVFSIKILGITFDNAVPVNSNWDKISANIAKRIHIWKRVRLSLRGRKIIIKQILLSKLWYIGQIYTIPKH